MGGFIESNKPDEEVGSKISIIASKAGLEFW